MTEIISILYMKMIDIFADLSKNGRIERAVRKTTKDGGLAVCKAAQIYQVTPSTIYR